MCRRNQMQGACLLMLGLGLILGYCLENWVVCNLGGVGLMGLGIWTLWRR